MGTRRQIQYRPQKIRAVDFYEIFQYNYQMDNKWHRRFYQLASHVADWSKDPSTQVGACLVNDDKQVISLGFNGFPRGVEDTIERLIDKETKYKFV